MKNFINFKYLMVRYLGVFALLSVLMMRCKDPDLVISTTDDVNITGYLDRFPDNYSEFRKILDITGNASFLAAYGTYTIFVPNNEAVKQFVQEKGKTSVDQLDVEELKAIVRFHLLGDTVSTQTFTDGKINQPTMYGQYLTTGATNVGGESFLLINKEAKVVKSNVKLGNGLLHEVDKVMQPATKTLAQLLDADPNFSIFAEAAKATGLYDTLNIPAGQNNKLNRKWLTLIAESNATLAQAGFNSFESLKNRLSHTGDPKNPKDSLYLYVAYHILPRNSYVADLITSPSHGTLAPLEVITTRMEGTTLKLNADEFLGVREAGAEINREKSDFSATNGVFHTVKDHFKIKVRKPTPVYWEVTDQPELRRMVNIFRKLPGTSTNITPGTLSEVTWPKNNIVYVTSSGDRHVFWDYFSLNMRPAVIPEITFKTPLLVKGKYKVWVCYRRVNANDIQAFFNDVPLPRLFGLNPTPGFPSGVTPEEAEAQGWKMYTFPTDNRYVGRMIGVIDVKTTDRHDLRFLGLTNRGGSTGNAFRLDMIHFIPIDANQILPRFEQDGTPVFE